MSKNFWFGYTAFFVFVFPLFFSSLGGFWSPMMSTISLAVGFIGWLLFIRWTYIQTISKPKKMEKNIHSLLQKGKLEQGRIVDKIVLKKRNNNMEDIEIVVEFKNLSDTMVKQLFRFTDSRPHEKRYEEGNHVNLRISTENQSPAIILAETKVSTSFGFGIFALCFLVVYMLGTLVVHYHLFSNGNGWRFITLMHPWVFTPFCGMLFFKFIIGVSTGLISSDPKAEEKLILYGRKVEAIVQRADQTGTYINEQPQLKFVLKYADYTGKSHSVTFKKIIPLTQLHTIQAGGTQNILYLPNDPEKIIFAD